MPCYALKRGGTGNRKQERAMSDLSEQKKLEEGEKGQIKISALMREGCKYGKQLVGQMANATRDSIDSCAIGAIGVARVKLGIVSSLEFQQEIQHANDAFFHKHRCSIMTANDSWGWSREYIANELERLGH
jgi:hypothetical protein